MKERILIRMNEPEDWLRSWDEGTQVVNDFILPRGIHMKDEMSDTIYHKDATVPYHEHCRGTETFFIAEGSVECFIRGKHFVVNKGDILHIQPYTPHGFRHLEEGTVWRELFQEIDMAQGIYEKNSVHQKHPQYLEDADFLQMYRDDGTYLYSREEAITAVAEDVDKHTMYEVRTPEFAYETYQGDGFSLRLKIGRWECGGVKEVWQAFLDKGLCVEFNYPHKNWELYYIVKGTVKFEVEGEVYMAAENCLVHIPPYHAHTMEVMEDAEVYDCGGETFLMDLLEDYRVIKATQPEKLNCQEFKDKLFHKFNCYVTGVYKK